LRGIDNALYRAWGCDAPFRNPATGTLDLRENAQMQEGLYTVVIRMSGNQDPMNDSDATVEIGYSPDKIVRDAVANVASDYSYRIVKSEQYTKLKAKIVDGVVETEQVDRLHVPRIGWFPRVMGDADFHKGKLSLKIDPDGRMLPVLSAVTATGWICWRKTPSPRPAPSRASATMKTRSASTMPSREMPTACLIPRQAGTPASPWRTASRPCRPMWSIPPSRRQSARRTSKKAA